MGLESPSRKMGYSLLPAVGSQAFGGDGYVDVVVERVEVDAVTHGWFSGWSVSCFPATPVRGEPHFCRKKWPMNMASMPEE